MRPNAPLNTPVKIARWMSTTIETQALVHNLRMVSSYNGTAPVVTTISLIAKTAK